MLMSAVGEPGPPLEAMLEVWLVVVVSGQLSASAELGSPRGRVGDGQTGLPAICDT